MTRKDILKNNKRIRKQTGMRVTHQLYGIEKFSPRQLFYLQDGKAAVVLARLMSDTVTTPFN